jgi:nitroimidazol reductase NimA-like FMN-containing flavoprotein (pyridoxamine 5'-phosphate oxidase superfamily)
MVGRRETQDNLRRFFSSQSLGVLATEGDGKPHTSLVAFAFTEDLTKIIFATTRASRKCSNISFNPNVAMLVDNRVNTIMDFKDAMAVTALGKAREPKGVERDGLLRLYMERHDYLGDFAESPTIALLVIDVEMYNIVTRFQRVLELKMHG